ncbi:ABC transporter ATP-binding protein [Xylocopilactobacillus apicola]|uniref:ABC transporter ATP-binding protein n=1 Tax=Xylocopilactobacillus apicola TaxID=2932184 RepID=A0AAU9D5R4_9LACO|nr:ABC transporter ATP-binding protein [Xylocopilactobacillus apicola]BDR59154.1 ABC transporter ATP-binding protein [Xylocopilactobacillus apicola]
MLKTLNMTKKFDQRTLFDHLNLEFKSGKVYALIGPSGSGKTTLLNILGHLEKIDDGDILYDSKSLFKIKTQQFFRHDLGYLFQNFGLLESQTISDNLDLGLIGQKLEPTEKKQKKLNALKQVNLEYLKLDQKIYSISGGEAQRVALAKVILKDPPLILADEPTAALDPTNGDEVMKLLLSLKNDHRTIIIATHNNSIWEQADEIIDISTLS